MKNWKYGLFLSPAILVLAGAVAGIQQDLPIVQSAVKGLTGGNKIVEAQTISRKDREDEQKKKDGKAKGKASTQELKQGKWKDGVYEGSALGYGGMIRVSVTIKDGKITDITVLDHQGETPEYYAKAQIMIQKILQAQSPQVDTVSGATLSSNGIRQAVIQALNQAVLDENDKVWGGGNLTERASADTKKNTASRAKNKAAKGVPADGTYTGSAVCEKFDYVVTIKVTFQDGKATKIFDLKITKNTDPDNEAYWVKAYKPTVKNILLSQSGDVDVVSGATYSSNAIMDAFEDAKAKAVAKNGGKAMKKPKNHKDKNKDKDGNKLIDDGTEIVTPEKVADGTYHVRAICAPDEDEDFETYTMYADVTFVEGKLTKIENLSSDAESNQKYYLKAAEGTKKETGVVAQLLEKQSVSGISAVSGATCSSKTILMLYAEALKEAAGTDVVIDIGEETTQSVQPETTGNADDNKEVETTGQVNEPETTGIADDNKEVETTGHASEPESTGIADDNKEVETTSHANEPETADNTDNKDTKLLAVKDGVYYETVVVEPDEDEEFDPYSLMTEISFQSGLLTKLEIISSTDDDNQAYYEKALNGTKRQSGILTQLLEKPLDVPDIVSGATCSFNSLYEAFLQACEDAKE